MKPKRDKLAGDVVDQAVAALRAGGVPDVPPEVLSAAADAVAARAGDSSIQFKRKRFHMRRIIRIAAMLAVAAGLVGLVGYLTVGSGGATVAWADVQQQIRSVQTLVCLVTTKVDAPSVPEQRMKISYMDPGLMRLEMTSPQEGTNIINLCDGTILSLLPAQKMAQRIATMGLAEQGRDRWDKLNWAKRLQQLAAEKGAEIGQREINGRPAKGFHVVQENQDIELWVDAESGRPVEMLVDAMGAKMELTDMRFNEPLDPGLFRQEVPQGYTVQDMAINIVPSSENVARILQLWATVRGGTFPDTLSPAQFAKDMSSLGSKEFAEEVMKQFGKPGQSDEQATAELASAAGGAMVIFQKYAANYRGADVSMGQADTPIFWFKLKPDEPYSVIYADLHVEDVAEADLPARPATAPAPAAPQGSF